MPRPHQHRPVRSVPALATAAGLALGALALAAGSTSVSAASGTVVVHADESIQAALDAAAPHTRIVVAGGVHAEQLTISSDGITLVGAHARLVPPAVPVTNTCSGLAGDVAAGVPTQAGICVTGSDVTLAPFRQEHRKLVSVGDRVSGVTIAGFQVEGFSGANVAFVGAADATLVRTTLIDGVKYGALTVGSTGTRFTHNVVGTNTLHEIGMCVDDVTPATVANNDVSGYGVGLCVQTQAADIRRNTVHDNCVGIYVDPGIGADIRDNRISSNNAPCENFNGGVWLAGTNGTVVTGNRIIGHTPAGFGAGLIVMDDPAHLATNNTIRDNRFRDNTLDLLVDTNGTGNTITDNACTTSDPAGLCD
jgi:nitrous oxidase accessory protein NosD